jgi:hypothetical protein
MTAYKFAIAALSLAGLAISTPIVSTLPAIAQAPTTVAPKQQKMSVSLKQEKKVTESGKVKFVAVSKVKPGDVIRYTATGKTNVELPGIKLVIPIPKGTKYVMSSAKPIQGAELGFSIDGGKTFSPKPMLDPKKAAPATAYTHVRWRFAGKMPAKSEMIASCEAEVK